MSEPTPLRLAVLCSDEPHNDYLVDLLHSHFLLQAVVVEPGHSQIRRLWQRQRYVDFTFAYYHHWRRRLTGLAAYRRNYFKTRPTRSERPMPVRLVVDNINDHKVETLLSSVRPDITVVISTSILGRRLLAACGPQVVNVHGGYLPHYKGNHCFFFALYNEDFARVGSTIHFVDAGVDTGPIIETVSPDLRPHDNAETLYCRSQHLAIHRLEQWLSYHQEGHELPRIPQPAEGRQYFTRTRGPLHDLAFLLRRRLGLLRIPPTPQPTLPPVGRCRT
jgi:methionyl-tRNA formyltransferase